MKSNLLEVVNLSKIFKQHSRMPTIALNSASLFVDHGEIVGLLGQNGAGKTTLLKCISGLVSPTYGQIILDGADVSGDLRQVSQKVSILVEGNRNIYWRLSPEENLEFFSGIQGLSLRQARTVIDQLLEILNLNHKRKVPVRMLSRGMQ